MTPEEFQQSFMPYAQGVSQRTGLDPRMVLAQAALETGWGRSAPNNNFFGIKSHGQSGGSNLMTQEFQDGRMVSMPQSFRGYENPEQSFQGYADFILDNPRYGDVMAQGDLAGQIGAMGQSGYATDPDYASKLASIARRFGGDIPAGQQPTISTRNAPDTPQAVGRDTRSALGLLQNEGNQMAQQPQGLLGSLGVQRRDPNAQGETSQPFYNRQSFGDTLARLAPALGRMGVMGLEGPMQAQLDTRNQRQGDERAQAMLDTQRNQTREWIASQPNGEQYAAMFDAVGGEATLRAMQVDATGNATTVQSSVPLDDGTTVMIMRDGSRRVLSPTGEELTGQAAADAIRVAREYTVENQTAIYEGRRVGTNTGETNTGESAAAAGARGAAIGSQDAADEIKLREMQRNLPGLMGVVDRLDALSGTATFSRVEVAADSARRALGQEVSAGGIARAEYIATVDNEILPLLRQTFGAAFTVEEGARLRATLGNEDGTPAERRATLNAFIQQKQAELESFGGSMPAPAPPAGGSIDVDPALLEFMTPEERALFQ
jgi:hypothetical protein